MSRTPKFSEPSKCLSIRVPKSQASLIRKIITAVSVALDSHKPAAEAVASAIENGEPETMKEGA